MKKAFLVILVLGLVIGIVCPLFPETIFLIHSNDIHGNFRPYKIKMGNGERLIGGMEAASHYLNQLRAREKNVLLIDAGDLVTGTLASEINYKGVIGGSMIEFLNRLGYDAWCYGNHSFDRGQKNALGLARLAKFPTIMANIVYKDSGRLFPVKPYHIFDIAGLKVGVIAVMNEYFLINVEKEKIKGLDVLPVIPTLNSYVPVLDKHTDLIVVLAHGQRGWFDEGVKIAKNVAGIDIVLVASEDGKFKDVDGVLVKSTLGHQRTLGYIKVEVENDRVASYEEKLIWLWADVGLKPSPQVTAFVKEIEASIGEEYAKVIGEAKLGQTRKGYPIENALGNWITDSMRLKTGTQIALHNSNAIRADILAGPITKADIFEVAPFHNTLVVFELTGQQLKDILERDIERGWDRLQVSGLKYRYCPKDVKPYGERVVHIEVNGEILEKDGKVLQPKKVYIVVSNDYLIGHAENKYFGFPVAEARDTGLLLTQVLMDWLAKYKVLDYKFEKRILELSN